VVLVLLCAWAIHFRSGWAQGRGYLAEMGLFLLVVFVGLFYLWRKEGRA
jgi:NADH:ubiquinone oxidoreductase subunit 3 (subunit A)